MIEGRTKSGFKFKVDERVTSDWRVLSSISKAESDNLTEQVIGITELVSVLLGNNEKALMEHIKKKNDGFVPTEAVTSELADILKATKELKN